MNELTNCNFYPTREEIMEKIKEEREIVIAISFDGTVVDIGVNFSDVNVKGKFVATIDMQSAEWEFSCPEDYKGILDENIRFYQYYLDGIKAVSETAVKLGYFPNITIPARIRQKLHIL